MLVPLLVAALVSVAAGVGSSWYLARQMDQRVEQAIAKALAEASRPPERAAAPVTATADRKTDKGAATPESGTKDAPRKDTPRKEPPRKVAPKEDPDDGQKAAREAGLFQLGTEPIVANPAGSDGSRFVVCRVTLESVDKANIGPLVEANMDRLKDAVTGYLADTPLETLQSRGFKGQLATQLALAFNRILGPGTVKGVIIPQLVVQ